VNLWHYLRRHDWSNRIHENYEALREAALQGWRATCLDTEKIKSVCAASYLQCERLVDYTSSIVVDSA